MRTISAVVAFCDYCAVYKMSRLIPTYLASGGFRGERLGCCSACSPITDTNNIEWRPLPFPSPLLFFPLPPLELGP